MKIERFCCQQCFTEKNIAQFISENGNFKLTCSYCETENVQAINPELIFQFVEKFAYGLKEDSAGKPLFDVLNEDFCFFEDKVIDKMSLLTSILDENLDILDRRYFVPDLDLIKDSWIEFCQEITTKNRFFPQTKLYKDIFTNTKEEDRGQTNAFILLVDSLTKFYSTERCFYRARVHESKLLIDQMRAPPSITVTAGRANPIGISYLYLAENEKTCIAEVRPSNGSLVSVATFNLKTTLSILDLTNPRKKASFLLQESESLENSLIHINLLEIFANELSKPVLPNRTHLDYIPTQFICEFFKTVCGFHGLVFNSSFGNGKNIVLFDQNLVEDDSMKYFRISSIDHNYSLD